MRLFVAINFDSGTKQKLLDIQAALKYQTQGSFTRPENLHLTLVFLGEVDEKRVPDAERAIAALSLKPVGLVFSGTGSFGGGVYYVGFEPSPGLIGLQSELEAKLRAERFAIENRAFIPHVTLARKLKSKVKIANTIEPLAAEAERISLMKSETNGGKLVYTEIFARRFALISSGD